MATRIQEQLEAMKRELEAQDEAWQRAKETLARLGDVRIAVPRELLEEIDAVTTVTQPATPFVVGVRG
jgi:hypothetical protein